MTIINELNGMQQKILARMSKRILTKLEMSKTNSLFVKELLIFHLTFNYEDTITEFYFDFVFLAQPCDKYVNWNIKHVFSTFQSLQ